MKNGKKGLIKNGIKSKGGVAVKYCSLSKTNHLKGRSVYTQP